jgi:hypothetical protein
MSYYSVNYSLSPPPVRYAGQLAAATEKAQTATYSAWFLHIVPHYIVRFPSALSCYSNFFFVLLFAYFSYFENKIKVGFEITMFLLTFPSFSLSSPFSLMS